MQQPDGKELIDRYYATAPTIVKKINSLPNRKRIYQKLNRDYLLKCLDYLEVADNKGCKKIYIQMMEHLFEEEKTWQ